MNPLSPNTQAILLMTAPLLSGRKTPAIEPLKPAEYKSLVRCLRRLNREPADLLGSEAESLVQECAAAVEPERLRALLGRGFALAQAVDQWSARAVWVISRADEQYPARLKQRLGDDAPAVLYGAGEISILNTGGLAVVGSRRADDELLRFAEEVGRLTASAQRSIISGGARGIDLAAMQGAATEGGVVVGVVADRLQQAVVNRENRTLLMENRLALISPYDPSAGFNVGHAMQRNKVIYALADAALVVNADYNKGGTWAGAVEQLEKYRLVPVYVRANGAESPALKALRRKGALPWPTPETAEALRKALTPVEAVSDTQISLLVKEGAAGTYVGAGAEKSSAAGREESANAAPSPAEELFATVHRLLKGLVTPATPGEVAARLQVTEQQAKRWLDRLVDEGVLEKLARPVRYRVPPRDPSLFDEKA